MKPGGDNFIGCDRARKRKRGTSNEEAGRVDGSFCNDRKKMFDRDIWSNDWALFSYLLAGGNVTGNRTAVMAECVGGCGT